MGPAGVTLTVRRATGPGVLYPAEPDVLARAVDGLLEEAAPLHPQLHDGVPKAVIVPHDALAVSGMVAAAAYSRLRPWRHSLRSVVVLGPCDHTDRAGVALPDVGAFETPLGQVRLDQDACSLLLDANPSSFSHHRSDAPHPSEERIEVQLPYLQRVLAEGWSLVPVLCAGVDPRDMADLLEPLWTRPGTLVVVSSDLSHGHDQRTAQHLDQRTSAAITARWWEALGEGEVTGATGVRSVLELARRHDQQVTPLEFGTSADRGGPADVVTGYGSFLVR